MEQHLRPELITKESGKPLSDKEIVKLLQGGAKRLGDGAIIRNGPKPVHVCQYPDLYRSPELKVGAVWRCNCGRRWTLEKVAHRTGAHGSLGWVRRFWPWPR